MKKRILKILITVTILGFNLQANEDFFKKFNNIDKGKYPVQIDTLDGFVNYLKCDEIITNDNKNVIGCKKNSKLNYMIFKNKKEFDNICITNFNGNIENIKANNKWVDYSVCTNSITKEEVVATKVKVLENKKDIYIVSFSNRTAISENEPLLLYFMQTIVNTKDKKLITNF